MFRIFVKFQVPTVKYTGLCGETKRAARLPLLPSWLPGYCYDQGRHRPALYKVFDSLLERTKTSRVSPLGGSSIAHWTKPWNKENCDIILSIDGVDVSFLCLCTQQSSAQVVGSGRTGESMLAAGRPDWLGLRRHIYFKSYFCQKKVQINVYSISNLINEFCITYMLAWVCCHLNFFTLLWYKRH